MTKRLGKYLFGYVVLLSSALNAVLGGEAPETVSYRAAKARRDQKRWGCVLCRVLDAIHRDHCQRTLNWWERKQDVRKFADAILHGDDEHRAWLTEAAEAFIAGRPLPMPRDKDSQT